VKEDIAMGLLKRLFVSPEVVSDMARSAVKGLDDIVYTEQEKAEKTQAAQQLYAEMWMAAVPSALSRRLIAVIMVAVWAFLIIAGVLFYAFGLRDPAEFTFKVLAEVVQQPMNIVVGFYFLKQVVSTFMESKK
jgi:hypothetical protein